MTENFFNSRPKRESNSENEMTYDRLRNVLLDLLSRPAGNLDDTELINLLRRSFNLETSRIPALSSVASIKYVDEGRDLRFDVELFKILEELKRKEVTEIPDAVLEKVRLMKNSPMKAKVLANLFRTYLQKVNPPA